MKNASSKITLLLFAAALLFARCATIGNAADASRSSLTEEEDAAFTKAAASYRAATVKPTLPEEARKFKVQAEFAFSKKEFAEAAERYKEALDIAPWWPEGRFNRALILGELFSYRDAIREMKRYLTLVPDATNARAAQDKIYQWEGIEQVRSDKEKLEKAQAQESEEKARALRYGPKGGGFSIGFSPAYKPLLTSDSDLGSTLSSSFDVGFRFSGFHLGFRSGSGDVATASSYNVKTKVTTALKNGKHQLSELFLRQNFEIGSPSSPDKGLHFFIPVHGGLYYNSVQFSKVDFYSAGFTLGSGLQASFYTASPFSFDLGATYIFGFPINKIQNNDAEIIELRNAKGEQAQGSVTGLDLRVGATLHF